MSKIEVNKQMVRAKHIKVTVNNKWEDFILQ